jgi:type IV fimbrial biogenesis protein FimT
MRRSHPLRGPGLRLGVTLPELAVIVAILGILVALAVPGLHDFMLKQRLRAVHAQLVTDLQMARSEAAARNLPVNVRFNSTANSTCYSIFTNTAHNYQGGPSLACNCTRQPTPAFPTRQPCSDPSSTEIRTATLPKARRVELSTPGDSAFGFEPGTGNLIMAPSEPGAVSGSSVTVLTSIGGTRSLAAVVGLSGRPSVCQPAGSSMGVTPC